MQSMNEKVKHTLQSARILTRGNGFLGFGQVCFSSAPHIKSILSAQQFLVKTDASCLRTQGLGLSPTSTQSWQKLALLLGAILLWPPPILLRLGMRDWGWPGTHSQLLDWFTAKLHSCLHWQQREAREWTAGAEATSLGGTAACLRHCHAGVKPQPKH